MSGMTSSTKIFATLSLSAALGRKIHETENSEILMALGGSLYETGLESTGKYPFPGLKASKVVQINNAVGRLLSSPQYPPEILSMLIAGLVDIHSRVKLDNKALIDPVIYCAQACLDAYDYEPDHEAAWERYQDWVES